MNKLIATRLILPTILLISLGLGVLAEPVKISIYARQQALMQRVNVCQKKNQITPAQAAALRKQLANVSRIKSKLKDKRVKSGLKDKDTAGATQLQGDDLAKLAKKLDDISAKIDQFAQAASQPVAKPTTQTKGKTLTKTTTQTKSGSGSKSQTKASASSKPQSKADVKAAAKADAKAGSKTDAKAETKANAKAQTK